MSKLGTLLLIALLSITAACGSDGVNFVGEDPSPDNDVVLDGSTNDDAPTDGNTPSEDAPFEPGENAFPPAPEDTEDTGDHIDDQNDDAVVVDDSTDKDTVIPEEALDMDDDGHLSIAHGGEDCDDNDAQRYPGAQEHPTAMLGRDRDCDGMEDGTVSRGIFVAAHGDDTSEGSAQAPVASFEQAVVLLQDDTSRDTIYVLYNAEAIQPEPGILTIPANIDVHGGYTVQADGSITRTDEGSPVRLEQTIWQLSSPTVEHHNSTALLSGVDFTHAGTAMVTNAGYDYYIEKSSFLRLHAPSTIASPLLLTGSADREVVVHVGDVTITQPIGYSRSGIIAINNAVHSLNLNIVDSSVVIGAATNGEKNALLLIGNITGNISDNTFAVAQSYINYPVHIIGADHPQADQVAPLFLERNHIVAGSAIPSDIHDIAGVTIYHATSQVVLRNNHIENLSTHELVGDVKGVAIHHSHVDMLNNTIYNAATSLWVDAPDHSVAVVNNILSPRNYGTALFVDSHMQFTELSHNLFAANDSGVYYRFVDASDIARVIATSIDIDLAEARINGDDPAAGDEPSPFIPTFASGGSNLIGNSALELDNVQPGDLSDAYGNGLDLSDRVYPDHHAVFSTININLTQRETPWNIGAY